VKFVNFRKQTAKLLPDPAYVLDGFSSIISAFASICDDTNVVAVMQSAYRAHEESGQSVSASEMSKVDPDDYQSRARMVCMAEQSNIRFYDADSS